MPEGRSSFRRAGARRPGSRSTEACGPRAAGKRNSSRRRICGRGRATAPAACAARRDCSDRCAHHAHAPRRWLRAWRPSRPVPRFWPNRFRRGWYRRACAISPAITARLMVRIDAISGSFLIVSTARRIPPMRSRRRLRSGRNWRRSSGRASRRLLEDDDGVEHTVEIALQMHGRRLGPFLAGGSERHQVAGKVAAVDTRNVERVERIQCARVVPVVEMAAMTLHALDRRQRRFDPFDGIGQADPAEVARRDHRQEIDADIGRRGASGDDRTAGFLKIVRRQMVVFRRHEGLEIEPGAARDGAQPQPSDRRYSSRSSVSAERLTNQAKAGDRIQNSEKKSADKAPDDPTAAAIAGRQGRRPPRHTSCGNGPRCRCRGSVRPARRCAIRAGIGG